jgi:post-segregation antitoxin (ccd killing protein)
MVAKMGKYETISIKVSQELKDKMRKLGIKPSELLRKALEEEIRRRQFQEIKKEIQKLQETLSKIPAETVVQSIREDREHR